MLYQKEIEALESEWDVDNGFFWHIRDGLFIPAELERVMAKLTSVSLQDDELIPRRLVSLLWYAPVMMEWQDERVVRGGTDPGEFSKAVSRVRNEIERILGVP